MWGRPFSQLATGVLLLGLVVSAPFGGWRDADGRGPQTVEPGATVSTGPLEITIDAVGWSARPAASFSASTVGVYLMVNGTVRNPGSVPVQDEPLADTIRIKDLDGQIRSDLFTTTPVSDWAQAKPRLYHREDANAISSVGPSLTYRVAWVVERVGPGADLPETLTVEVRGQTYRRHSLNDRMEWLDSTPIATVTVPVEQRPAYQAPTP